MTPPVVAWRPPGGFLKTGLREHLYAGLQTAHDWDMLAPFVKSPCRGVFVLEHAFSRSFCSDMLEALEKCESIAPNSMNKYGVVLRDIGMGPLCEELLEHFVAPLAKRFYPHVKRLRDYHGFLVRYTASSQASLDLHRDQSDVTLNVCLGRKFTGGKLVFRDEADRVMMKLDHRVGTAVVHLGDQLHQAQNVRTGMRANLILWCRTEQR